MTNINDLYVKALGGEKDAEAMLFHQLAVIFPIFIRQKQVSGIDKEDIEDIVQAALMKIARSFRETELRSSFAAWAYTILKNELIDFCRSRTSYRRNLAQLGVESRPKPELIPDPTLEKRLKECLRRLHQTQPSHARIINLHYQGYTTNEICDKMGITANNMHIILYRARIALRACLNAEKGRHE